MENLYLTVISLSIGLINTVLVGVIAALYKKTNNLTESVHTITVNLAVLSAQLRERRIINGEAKVS